MHNRLKLLLNLIRYRIGLIGKQAVLLDTPEHDNLGDQAIALAEVQFLTDSGILFAELPASGLDYAEKWFARMTPTSKTILIQGGGFLGSLWPGEEYRVQRIIQHFSKNRIVVFPQTVFFGEQDEIFEKAMKVYNGHPDLTILARDTRSYDFLKRYFRNVTTMFVPDMVLYLQPGLPQKHRAGALLCLRDDTEKAMTDEMAEMLENELKIRFCKNVQNTDTLCGHTVDRLSRQSTVLRKLEEFSGAKLVVTDRLHGMLFSAITGTPCIAFDNCNGKVHGVYHWLKDLDYIFLAEDADSFKNAFASANLDKACAYNRERLYSYFETIRGLICQK